MLAVFFSLVAMFLWSAHHRWNLLMVGGATRETRFADMGKRLAGVWEFAFFQKKMRYYFLAGLAHNFIFLGFVVLLFNTLILWGRGISPEFNLFIFGPEPVFGIPLGHIYAFLKEVFAVAVIFGALVFVYYRTINVQKRMKLSLEGLLILMIILTMMISDIFYVGASNVLWHRMDELCGPGNDVGAWCERAQTIVAHKGGAATTAEIAWRGYPEPAGSAAAMLIAGLGVEPLVVISHVGFWAHASLVLIFLNILPYSKHFHIITAIPNVMHRDITSPGRLRPIAKNTEELMALVEKATEEDDMGKYPIGYARIEHFTWKDILDFYTCTECGRCSDNCPAFTTGKILSPKALTVDLRDHLYARQEEFATAEGAPRGGIPLPDVSEDAEDSDAEEENKDTDESADDADGKYQGMDLVPNVVHEDVLWACTTCRACEEQCPVMITYVDKIVAMRRNLVTIRGEFPAELNKPFEAMETNGNPWNLSQMDRANWAEGLDLKTFAEHPKSEVLYWVGCAASYDDRAKKISRATALLLKEAGIDFAILGEEETCTGDPARRAGNEFLALTLQEANTETLNGYKEQGGIKKIVTTCPHCFNTLLNEYPDVGASYEVVHHTDYLLDLVKQGKLKPTESSADGEVVYHDSCYLGRYNDVYDSPRELLGSLPGVRVLEAEYWNRNKGLCCGAGGAQMWMEEQNTDRVSVKRTKQLLDTGAKTIASACPFCMTMLTDGLKAEEKEDEIKQLDVVELLAVACGVSDKKATADAAEEDSAEEASPPAE